MQFGESLYLGSAGGAERALRRPLEATLERGQQQRTVRTADNSASRYQPSHPGKKTTKALLESAETKTEEGTEEKTI